MSDSNCACGEDHNPAPEPTPSAEKAFCEAVVQHMVRGHAAISDRFVIGAFRGRVMRLHVNEAHPDQVEDVEALGLPNDDTAEGWLFGYRHEDSTTLTALPAPQPRGGDEQGTHTGDARGGGGDGEGTGRDGSGARGAGSGGGAS